MNQKFGKNQKYLPRTRFLYALVFRSENAIYVGQTVDLRRRHREHAGRDGGWNRAFEFVELGEMTGNHFDAEKHEFAWRLLFHRQNWRIYGKPPAIQLRNPSRSATHEMKILSYQLKAPEALHRQKPSALTPKKLIAVVAAGLFSLYALAMFVFSLATKV